MGLEVDFCLKNQIKSTSIHRWKVYDTQISRWRWHSTVGCHRGGPALNSCIENKNNYGGLLSPEPRTLICSLGCLHNGQRYHDYGTTDQHLAHNTTSKHKRWWLCWKKSVFRDCRFRTHDGWTGVGKFIFQRDQVGQNWCKHGDYGKWKFFKKKTIRAVLITCHTKNLSWSEKPVILAKIGKAHHILD